MIVLLDGMVLENTSFDSSDRGAVLAAIHKSVASKGRIVSSLSLDGENISEESFLASTQGQ